MNPDVTPEQQQLEQAITNMDKVVAAFQCDRQSRNIIEAGWQQIVKYAREAVQPVDKTEADAATSDP